MSEKGNTLERKPLNKQKEGNAKVMMILLINDGEEIRKKLYKFIKQTNQRTLIPSPTILHY